MVVQHSKYQQRLHTLNTRLGSNSYVTERTGKNKLCHWNGRIMGIRHSTTADRTPCTCSKIRKMNKALTYDRFCNVQETQEIPKAYGFQDKSQITKLGHTITTCFSRSTPVIKANIWKKNYLSNRIMNAIWISQSYAMKITKCIHF